MTCEDFVQIAQAVLLVVFIVVMLLDQAMHPEALVGTKPIDNCTDCGAME